MALFAEVSIGNTPLSRSLTGPFSEESFLLLLKSSVSHLLLVFLSLHFFHQYYYSRLLLLSHCGHLESKKFVQGSMQLTQSILDLYFLAIKLESHPSHSVTQFLFSCLV